MDKRFTPRPVAAWYMIAAIASLLFMGAGCAAFVMHVASDRATLPLDQRALVEAEKRKEGMTQYYEVEYDRKSVHLTHEGIAAAQDFAGVGSFYVGNNMEWPHLMEQALRAKQRERRNGPAEKALRHQPAEHRQAPPLRPPLHKVHRRLVNSDHEQSRLPAAHPLRCRPAEARRPPARPDRRIAGRVPRVPATGPSRRGGRWPAR